MVESYIKGQKQVLSDEFSSTDFDCHCAYDVCATTLVDVSLCEALTDFKKILPDFRITSGFRCPQHNKDVGGEVNSFHLSGKAADISSPSTFPGDLAKIVQAIYLFKNGGIGIANNFVHLDVRGFAARWTYPIAR